MKSFNSKKSFLLFLLLSQSEIPTSVFSDEYGVDVSFPMHRNEIIDPAHILPDRQKIYDEYLEGCRKKYPKPRGVCEDSENGRVDMSLDQPKSMQNYTDVGYTKIKTPEKVWKLLQAFWEKNNPTDNIHEAKPENWSKGNSYVNHWVSPSYMVSVEDNSLRGGGYKLKDAIWDAAKSTLEEWTGEELRPCSLYGIRVYTEGAILATHVDRLPLVSSAIVNVAQDVDEPWPIEVIAHDGTAHNVTMEPGDMVLYESHSILHGRPFALKGRYFANVFIHFEPIGHTLRHDANMADNLDVSKQYRESVLKGQGGHENETNNLPPYIVKGSRAAEKWLTENDDKDERPPLPTKGVSAAHVAVQGGDTKTLLAILTDNEKLVHAKDENGWTPLHEAARAGSIEAVRLLVDKGADVNVKTEYGQSALLLATQEYGLDHPMVDLLTELGGVIFDGPEL